MSIRDLEVLSIRGFLESNSGLLTGDVLDFGCGSQPYRDVVERAGGSYHGYDSNSNPGSTVIPGLEDMVSYPDEKQWDAIVCTQVIQYAWWRSGDLSCEMGFLFSFAEWLKGGGWLLITGPTNWPVVETEDKYRFTASGIEEELREAGFSEVEVSYRSEVKFEGEKWPLGWKAKARA